MAKWNAKAIIKHKIEIEITASSEQEALSESYDLLNNRLPDLNGTYSGSKIDVTDTKIDVLAFYNKSDSKEKIQKEQNLNAYIAQLDEEEKEILKDLLF